MTLRLLAIRILNAAEALLGPLTRPARVGLLREHEEFRGSSDEDLRDFSWTL